jgi:hypothetical protein
MMAPPAAACCGVKNSADVVIIVLDATFANGCHVRQWCMIAHRILLQWIMSEQFLQ